MKKQERALELCDENESSVPEPIRYEGAIVAAGALTDMDRIDEAIARIESLDLNPSSAGSITCGRGTYWGTCSRGAAASR